MTEDRPIKVFQHQYNLVWNPEFNGRPKHGGVHVQHWYVDSDTGRVEGGFCLCGKDGVSFWTADDCRRARETGLDPWGEPLVQRRGIPVIPDHPTATLFPTCPECLTAWLRHLESEGNMPEPPSGWFRKPEKTPGVRYTLVWNPVAFDRISPGKVHVQTWIREERKWLRDTLLDGNRGSGYVTAADCRRKLILHPTHVDYIPDAPTIPDEPSNVDLPTCEPCRARWITILDHHGIQVPEVLRARSEPGPEPYTGDRHEAGVRARGLHRD